MDLNVFHRCECIYCVLLNAADASAAARVRALQSDLMKTNASPGGCRAIPQDADSL